MNIKLSYLSDKEFIGSNELGNEVKIDMRAEEDKVNQSPVELVLSGLGACASVDVVSMIKKRKRTFIDLHVDIQAERAETHPRGVTKTHMKFIITSPNLSLEEAEKIVELATSKYCAVAASLSATQTHSVEIIRQ